LAKELPTMRTQLLDQNATYYQPLLQPYNTLLLVWTGQSPYLERMGQYGEQRAIVKRPGPECHFEVNVDNNSWFDTIQGFADISYQATTRGGREMDNVLANKAAFKKTAHDIGNRFIDAADDTSSPEAAVAMLALGLIAHGIGSATNPAADIRCWLSLPGQFSVVPVQLTPGVHPVHVDCYDNKFRKKRTFDQNITVTDRPFQFHNIVVPAVIPEHDPNDIPDPNEIPSKV
jgi:hypothetical protein